MHPVKTAISVHAVTAMTSSGLVLRSHHESEKQALQCMAQTVDTNAIQVVPATVLLGSNGNVRLWRSL